MRSRSAGRRAGRRRTPSTPASTRARISATTSSAVAHDDAGVGRQRGALLQAVPHRLSLGARFLDEHEQVGEDAQGLFTLGGGEFVEDAGHRRGIRRRDEHQVGMLRGETEGNALVRQRGDEGLPLRRPRHDRGARDREELARDLDVVHALAVEEPARLEVAHDRVVFPRVGQPADGLGHLSRLAEGGEQRGVVFDATGCREPGRSVGAAPEVRALLRGGAGDDAHAPASPADVVEGLQPRGQVERLGVGRRDRRHETETPRVRGQERRQQHRIKAPADAVAAGLGIRFARSSAQAQRVFDRREHDAGVVGGAREVTPVGGGGELGGSGRGLTPRGRVPAGAVQRDGEGDAVRHRSSLDRGDGGRGPHCRPAARRGSRPAVTQRLETTRAPERGRTVARRLVVRTSARSS